MENDNSIFNMDATFLKSIFSALTPEKFKPML